MPTYHIIDRQACVVEWRFPVEAVTEAEALEKYMDGEHGEAIGPVVGDALEHYQYDLDIELANRPDLTPLNLAEDNGGTWGEHHTHTPADWRLEVENGDTRSGYWEWVLARIEAEEA